MNEQQWKALSQINSSPEGRHLREILKSLREDCRNHLERCRDNAEIARKQGEATVLAELIEKLETARDVIDTRFK